MPKIRPKLAQAIIDPAKCPCCNLSQLGLHVQVGKDVRAVGQDVKEGLHMQREANMVSLVCFADGCRPCSWPDEKSIKGDTQVAIFFHVRYFALFSSKFWCRQDRN